MNSKQINTFVDGVEGLSHVERYHGHQTISKQSVADHSCRVAMLAQATALAFYNGDINKANSVSVFALFHDFSESLLKSDINSSVKNQLGIREIVKQLEINVVNEAFDITSQQTYGDISRINDLLLEKCDCDTDYFILKICDSLDFGSYVKNEILLGNSYMIPLLEAFKVEFSKYPTYLTELYIVKEMYNRIVSE